MKKKNIFSFPKGNQKNSIVQETKMKPKKIKNKNSYEVPKNQPKTNLQEDFTLLKYLIKGEISNNLKEIVESLIARTNMLELKCSLLGEKMIYLNLIIHLLKINI